MPWNLVPVGVLHWLGWHLPLWGNLSRHSIVQLQESKSGGVFNLEPREEPHPLLIPVKAGGLGALRLWLPWPAAWSCTSDGMSSPGKSQTDSWSRVLRTQVIAETPQTPTPPGVCRGAHSLAVLHLAWAGILSFVMLGPVNPQRDTCAASEAPPDGALMAAAAAQPVPWHITPVQPFREYPLSPKLSAGERQSDQGSRWSSGKSCGKRAKETRCGPSSRRRTCGRRKRCHGELLADLPRHPLSPVWERRPRSGQREEGSVGVRMLCVPGQQMSLTRRDAGALELHGAWLLDSPWP